MAKKTTSSNDAPVILEVRNIPLHQIHMGHNAGRDETIGTYGHTEESLDRLAYSIELQGGLIHPVIVGPAGYNKEDVYKDTPADKHPLFVGFGRIQAYQKLNRSNPSDTRWHAIPAIIQSTANTSPQVTSLLENLSRKDLTTLEKADGLAAFKSNTATPLNDSQIGRLYGISKGAVSQYEVVRRMPAIFRNLLNDSEQSRGMWTEEGNTNVRNGITYKPLRFHFSLAMMNRISDFFKKRDHIPSPDDVAKVAQLVYAHWDKTGEWTLDPINALAAKEGLELGRKRKEDEKPATSPGTPAQSAPTTTTATVTQATSRSETPLADSAGNGGKSTGSAGRAETNNVKPEPPKPTDERKEAYGTIMALKAWASRQKHPFLQGLALAISESKWAQTNGVVVWDKATVEKLDGLVAQYLAEKPETAKTAA